MAIDRAKRWVFVRVMLAKTVVSACRFHTELARACPIKIRRILTDNAKEFTDLLFASRHRGPTGHHEFDKLCAELKIEHRPTKLWIGME